MNIFTPSSIIIVRDTHRFKCIRFPTIVAFVIVAPFVVSANRQRTRGLPSSSDAIRQPLDRY